MHKKVNFFSSVINLDYSNQDLTEEKLKQIMDLLADTTVNVYELNLLETGIKQQDVKRLASSVLKNTTLKVLKIQTYDDDSDELKQIIFKMKKHVVDGNTHAHAMRL